MSLLAQDAQLTRRVGAVALFLLAVAISFFVFIYDRIEWGSHIRMRVYFHTTGGLREGAPFVVAGQAVGKVESIAIVPRGARKLLDKEDGVEVKVAIESAWARRIQYGGDVFITSRGMLSGKYLEIGPPPPSGTLLPDGTIMGDAPRSLRQGDEILGRDPPSLDRVLQRTWDNLTTTAAFAADVRPEYHALVAEVDALRATLESIAPEAHLGDDITALRDEAARTYDALGGEAGIDRMRALRDHGDATLAQARAALAKLDASITALQAGFARLRDHAMPRAAEALDKAELAIDRVRATIAKIDPLLAEVEALQQLIERGDGSLMKLARDPEFPEDAKDLGKMLKRHPWKVIVHPK
jgi:ABC-type transporter Mla subunit MlaD